MLVYSEKYNVDLGNHVFPIEKYDLIVQKLKKDLDLKDSDFVHPKPASEKDLLLVHTKTYIDKLKKGNLSWDEIYTLELPFTKAFYEVFLLTVGGTIEAAHLALKTGTGIHLGGGFHHAFPDHGEGFCLLNDVACAARKLITEKKIKKILIIDLDLHQGNGTAFIFRDDKDVFTFSMHEEENYPFVKPPSDLDVNLPSGCDDFEYLKALKESLGEIDKRFSPDFVFYLAGSDPYRYDQLGRLKITAEGMAERDRFVWEYVKNKNLPVCVTLAGGYAVDIEDTVKIHTNTVKRFLGR